MSWIVTSSKMSGSSAISFRMAASTCATKSPWASRSQRSAGLETGATRHDVPGRGVPVGAAVTLAGAAVAVAAGVLSEGVSPPQAARASATTRIAGRVKTSSA